MVRNIDSESAVVELINLLALVTKNAEMTKVNTDAKIDWTNVKLNKRLIGTKNIQKQVLIAR